MHAHPCTRVQGDGNDVRVYVNNDMRYSHQFEETIGGLTQDVGLLHPSCAYIRLVLAFVLCLHPSCACTRFVLAPV